jgi:hypothetical protein
MNNFYLPKKLIILISLSIVIITAWITYDRGLLLDRARLNNIPQIMAGSNIRDFPVWGDVAKDIPLNLVTKIKDFSKVTTAPLGESATLYYIPIIGKALGFYYPYLSLLFFFCIILFVINYYAFLYCTNKVELFFLVISNVILIYHLAFYEFGLIGAYYVKGFAIPLLFGLFKILQKQGSIIPVLSLVTIFALLSNIRSSLVAVFLFFIVIIYLISIYKNKLKIIGYEKISIWVIGVLLGLFYLIKYLLGILIITNPDYLGFSQANGHVFWHTIWCSIGAYDPKNIYGFQWSDSAAWSFAENLVNKKIILASPEYESILKEYILAVFARDPNFILGFIVNRLFVNWFFYIALAINVTILFFKSTQKSGYFIIFLSLLPLSIFKAEEVLSISSMMYIYPVNVYILLVMIFAFLLPVQKLIKA